MIMAANWAGYVANSISLVVSARILGPEGRGAYSTLLVWSMTSASICDLSLGPAIARTLTIGRRFHRLRRLLPGAFFSASLAAVLLMTVFLMTFLRRSLPDPFTMPLALSIAPALILSAWGVYFFQGLASQVRYALARMLPPVICLALIVLQALDHLTLDGAVSAVSISYWLVGGWSAIVAWRVLTAHRDTASRTPPEGSDPRDVSAASLLGYGARTHLGTLASIANARLDLLLLSLIVPLAAVGNYALAVSLTTPIAIVGGGLAAANFRRIGSASANDLAIVRSVWRRFFTPTIGLAFLPAIAAFFIPHLVGREFSAAILPTLILAAGSCGFGAIYLGTNILQARGLPGVSSVLLTTAGLTSAVTLLPMVPHFGIVGAAMSSAFTYLLVGALCVPVTLHVYGQRESPQVPALAADLSSRSSG